LLRAFDPLCRGPGNIPIHGATIWRLVPPMIQILLIFTAVCIVAVLAGRAAPGARWLGVTAAVAIVYLVSLIVWWYALYFQVVPVYRTLAALNVYRTEGLLGALIFFGPPILPTAGLLVIAFRRLRHGRR
jgi:hypothetical protein